ncbi:MAG: hypothetical protein LBP58_05385, partial [Azoarcus sp.]|nr:hypothetical protein [Azoarcus sp.]
MSPKVDFPHTKGRFQSKTQGRARPWQGSGAPSAGMETPMREAQKRRTGAGWRFMANHSRK